MAPELNLEEESTAAFPVVLYNGENRINIGNVEIHPTLDYKQFRVALNQMTGISYNNLTTYLIDNNRDHTIQPEEQQRKILITSKVDFSGLVREKSTCYFLVVLKRSRRDRRQRKSRKQQMGSELPPRMRLNYPFQYHHHHHHHLEQQHLDIYVSQIAAASGTTTFGNIWFDEFEIQRANYINYVMIMNSNYGFDWSMIDRIPPKMMEFESCPRVQSWRNRDLCTECMNADNLDEEPGFHLCVYDEVVEGFFRSPAGPISRPR